MSNTTLPPPPRQDKDITGHTWQDWFRQLREFIVANYPAEFYFEVSRGNIANTSMDHVGGFNNVNTNGVENDVWFSGGILTWPTTATKMDLVSTSAADAAAGASARTVQIDGLDASFNLLSETIALNGVGTVTTVNSFIRVNKVTVITVGTYGATNAGAITIRVTAAGAIQGVIAIGVGITQKSHFTVPNGYTAYSNRASLDIESGKTAGLKFYKRLNAGTIAAPFGAKTLVHQWAGVTGNYEEMSNLLARFPAKTDLWFTITPSASSTVAHIDYDIVLVAG